MTLLQEMKLMVLPLEQPGKMYRKIGFALSVVPKKRHSGKQTDFVLTPVDGKEPG
jgi:hypothetical protein